MKWVYTGCVLLLLLIGCNHIAGKADHAGMLVETTIDDQAWGEQGYEGLKAIEKEYGVDVSYKEGINSYTKTVQAVEELANQGATVIFGHSHVYGNYFQQLHKQYPDIQFIYFNGAFTADNVTSLNFSAQAMGFFGGMAAGQMTESDKVGIIAAFEWQPEVEGFYEGVNFQNPQAEVEITFTNSWEDTDKALSQYERLEKQGADVFYPAGDVFNQAVIKQIKQDDHYAVGYVNDQSDVGGKAVLTSTIQKVDTVYKIAMEKFLNDNLPGRPLMFDFEEGAIEMGPYSADMPKEFQREIDRAVNRYIETGYLPNHQNSEAR